MSPTQDAILKWLEEYGLLFTCGTIIATHFATKEPVSSFLSESAPTRWHLRGAASPV
jgi:hypothetical protein